MNPHLIMKFIILMMPWFFWAGCASQPQEIKKAPEADLAAQPPPSQDLNKPAEPKDPQGLTKESLRIPIRDHLKEIRICYEATLERNPQVKGKLVVQWEIGQEGTATHFAPVKGSSTITDERLIQCVGDAIATWQFPIPQDQSTIEVRYPFYFRPNASEAELIPRK